MFRWNELNNYLIISNCCKMQKGQGYILEKLGTLDDGFKKFRSRDI